MKPTPAPLGLASPAPRPVPMGLLYTISRHRLGMSREQALDFVDACVDFAVITPKAAPGDEPIREPEAA